MYMYVSLCTNIRTYTHEHTFAVTHTHIRLRAEGLLVSACLIFMYNVCIYVCMHMYVYVCMWAGRVEERLVPPMMCECGAA